MLCWIHAATPGNSLCMPCCGIIGARLAGMLRSSSQIQLAFNWYKNIVCVLLYRYTWVVKVVANDLYDTLQDAGQLFVHWTISRCAWLLLYSVQVHNAPFSSCS